MSHASVRIVLVGAVAVASGSRVSAQDSRPSRSFKVGIAVGTTIPNGDNIDMPDDLGLHAQLSATWFRTTRLAVRGDLRAQMLAGTVAIPDCVPNAPCQPITLHPDQVYSVTASMELRPLAAVRRLSGLVGVGAYHARGSQSTNFGTTAGVLGGLGLDLGRPSGSGVVLEVQFHYLPNAFGTLTGMLTPSIAFRF